MWYLFCNELDGAIIVANDCAWAACTDNPNLREIAHYTNRDTAIDVANWMMQNGLKTN